MDLAGRIAQGLMRCRYRRNFCLPRYTPAGWWECDVFELTPGGAFREYEIKVSLQDFRADAKKSGWRKTVDRLTAMPTWGEGPSKHELLGQRSIRGPQNFYYVCPSELLALEDVPEWAGLIWTDPARPWNQQTVKPAPRLHKRPLEPKVEEHARSVIYYRMHDLLATLSRR